MSRPVAAPPARAGAAPHAPHAVERVGQAETEETLRLPHLPHMPHRDLASGGEKHAPEKKTQRLAALAARWEARTAARQAEQAAPEPEPAAVPVPLAPPPTEAPRDGFQHHRQPEGRDAWGLTGAERAAALARLEGVGPVPAPAPAPPPPDHWLARLAGAIAAALADGAEREADPDGWLVLIRPEGDRLVVAPHIVAELDGAGLLPRLPEAVARSTYTATARPACWSDPHDVPAKGDRCRCGGGRWWTSAPNPDGWCCSICHPPPPGRGVREVVTHSAASTPSFNASEPRGPADAKSPSRAAGGDCRGPNTAWIS